MCCQSRAAPNGAWAHENIFGRTWRSKLGGAVEGEHVGDDAGHDCGDGRAARHLDDGLFGDDLVYRRGACGIGVRGLHAAPGGAGAPRDDVFGMSGDVRELIHEGFTADDTIYVSSLSSGLPSTMSWESFLVIFLIKTLG